MDNILHDLKTLLIFSFLLIWESVSNFIISAVFLFLDLESLQVSKEYVSVIVWYLGSIAGLIYLFFRAYDMIMQAMKTRVEKKLAEKKLKESDSK
jgi:hypothetical protein